MNYTVQPIICLGNSGNERLFRLFVVVIQSPSRVWLFVTPWTAVGHASLSFTISWDLLRFMCTESVMPSNYLILCCPLSSCPQASPSSGSFSVSWLFPSSSQSIEALALAPSNEYLVLVPLVLTGLMSLQSKGLSRVFSSTTIQAHQFFSTFSGPTLTSIHNHWKNHSFD